MHFLFYIHFDQILSKVKLNKIKCHNCKLNYLRNNFREKLKLKNKFIVVSKINFLYSHFVGCK